MEAMETLNDILQFYSSHIDQWQYYAYTPMFLDGVLSDPHRAFCFIKDYFNIGGKSEPFCDQYVKKYQKDLLERSVHIVSTFLLGLKIADCVGINITERSNTGISFLYYWFLTCLYHDIGYVYEWHSSCHDLIAISACGLEAAKEACYIKYLHNREFATYSKNLVDIYLKGRATCTAKGRGVMDHGIIGGLLLYDRLRKQYEQSWKTARTQAGNSHDNFFVQKDGRTLYYSKQHYKEYAKAANAIIAHNIWQGTLNDYLTQNGKGPVALKKISLTNPLCFILCLADTIEPLKGNPNFIHTVFFSFADYSLSIEAGEDALSTVYKKIDDLSDWMDVAVAHSSNRITITINTSEG